MSRQYFAPLNSYFKEKSPWVPMLVALFQRESLLSFYSELIPDGYTILFFSLDLKISKPFVMNLEISFLGVSHVQLLIFLNYLTFVFLF